MRKKDVSLEDTIIIHGPGRSGTTLLNNILSLHPDLAWISGYVNRYPSFPQLSFLNAIQEIEVIERFARNKRKWPRPAEAYGFWDHCIPGFSNGYGYDLSPDKTAYTQKRLYQICQYASKARLITKLTGTARADVLKAVFNTPWIVYIDRDPRAVVASYYKQQWRFKNKPKQFEQQSFEDLIRLYSSLYQKFEKEKLALQQFRFIQVYYEDLTVDPQAFFKDLTDKINLPFTDRFSELISSWEIQQGTNNSWKKRFTSGQVAFLEAQLQSSVKALGYD